MDDLVKRLRSLVYEEEWLEEAAAEIERLKAALEALVDNVLDYERVNNLHPNPGRKYCWDTVARACEVLGRDAPSERD